jgi:hypothetical protein
MFPRVNICRSSFHRCRGPSIPAHGLQERWPVCRAAIKIIKIVTKVNAKVGGGYLLAESKDRKATNHRQQISRITLIAFEQSA